MIVTNPFSSGSWTRKQIDRVSKRWWVLLLSGILSVIRGRHHRVHGLNRR